MGRISPLAPAWAANRTAVRERKVEHHLQRFHRRYRKQVVAVAALHPALADLAISFPALLFVLAVPHKGMDITRLRQLAMAGAPLKAIAKLANLPLWTRKLPPEAFGLLLSHLPRQEAYARQIVNHLPKRIRLAERWLSNVTEACKHGDDAFAVWVAREWGTERCYGNELRRQALWAWFSARPHLTGHGLNARPWRPEIKRKAAKQEAKEWMGQLKLHLSIADKAVEPLWLPAGSFQGIDFVPLLSAESLHEEARIMENCIRCYGQDIALDQQRLWSMRRGGKRLATLSVGNCYDLGMLTITEIKGPKNEKVPRDVAITAKRWFNQLDVTAVEVKEKDWDSFIPNPKSWADAFKPYWLEKRCIPTWLPLAPTRSDFDML